MLDYKCVMFSSVQPCTMILHLQIVDLKCFYFRYIQPLTIRWCVMHLDLDVLRIIIPPQSKLLDFWNSEIGSTF